MCGAGVGNGFLLLMLVIMILIPGSPPPITPRIMSKIMIMSRRLLSSESRIPADYGLRKPPGTECL
jgi:hypothetical protein